MTPTVSTPPPALAPDETRRAYLNHEASVRSIGLLYFLGGGGSALAAVAMFFPNSEFSGTTQIVISLLLATLAALYIWLGSGLRRLDPGVRVGVTCLSCLGLLSVPIGTLINGYILYLLHSAKGKMVFSPEYREVMNATPHIVYKTSPLVVGLLVLLGLLVAIGLFAAFIGR